jgi:hypothetical protein
VIGRTIHAGMAWFAAKKCNFPDQKGHLHSRLSKVSCTPKWPSRRPLRVTLPRAHATVHSRGAFATLGRQWWASDTAEVPKNTTQQDKMCKVTLLCTSCLAGSCSSEGGWCA